MWSRDSAAVELLGRYSKLPKLPDLGHLPPRTERQATTRRVHSAYRRLGPDLIAQLVADHEAGQPTTVLMKTYGLGKGAVLGLLHDAGVSLRAQGQKNINIAEAAKRYGEGWSLVKLAAAYDCDAETVRTALKGAGVELRPRNGWPPAAASPTR